MYTCEWLQKIYTFPSVLYWIVKCYSFESSATLYKRISIRIDEKQFVFAHVVHPKCNPEKTSFFIIFSHIRFGVKLILCANWAARSKVKWNEIKSAIKTDREDHKVQESWFLWEKFYVKWVVAIFQLFSGFELRFNIHFQQFSYGF